MPQTVDLTMMHAIHAAIRRDLRTLADALDRPELDEPTQARMVLRWAMVREQLHHHHHTEDDYLWPLLRKRLDNAPAELALLDEMEAEHSVVDPLLEQTDKTVALLATEPREMARALTDLTDAVTKHLDHEEREALPLIGATITLADWNTFENGQKRSRGLRGAANFVPWLLDGVEPEAAARVLSHLPTPIRLLCKAHWQPAYDRKMRG